MKTLYVGAWLFVAAVFSATLGVVACASDDRAPSDAALESGTPSTVTDGSTALVDASADADAAPRTCSDDGFCHLALPAGKRTLRAVAADEQGTAWAVSDNGEILRYDAGAWKVHVSGLGALNTVFVASATDVWVGGASGKVFRGRGAATATLTFDAVTLPSAPVEDVRAIYGTSPGDVFVVTGKLEGDEGALWLGVAATGGVLHYAGPADGGNGGSWSSPNLASNVAFSHAWGHSGAGVFLAGFEASPPSGSSGGGREGGGEAVLFHRAPLATTFARVALPRDGALGAPLNGLGFIAGGASPTAAHVFLLGRIGGGLAPEASQPGFWLGKRRDGGTPEDGGSFDFTYEREGIFRDPVLRALTASGSTDAWAVGDSGRVRRFDGATWKTVAVTTTSIPLGKNLYGVWSGGPEDVWIVGEDVALRKGVK